MPNLKPLSAAIKAPSTPKTTSLTEAGRVARSNFEQQLEFEIYDDATLGMVKVIGDFIAEMAEDTSGGPGNGHTLTLLGRSGCGKTHLSRSAQKFAYEHLWRFDNTFVGGGREVAVTGIRDILFVDWTDLVERSRRGQLDDTTWEGLRKAWFLAVDDVGAGYETDYSRSLFFKLAHARVGSWTIFTSNMTIKQIEEIDERIASRLYREGGKVIQMKTAKDYNRR